jgi:YHS domain-containing protein
LIRLLVIMGLFYLLYRALKSWMAPLKTPTYHQKTPEIDDVMVKDPFCEVYFPVKDGVRMTHEGQELIFCSTRCRDKFIEALSEKQK